MTSFVGELNQGTLQSSLGKALSLSSAAWFLALYQDPSSWDNATKEALTTAIEQHSQAFFDNLGTSQTFPLKKDPRMEQIMQRDLEQDEKRKTIKIFTDMDSLEHALPMTIESVTLELARSEEEADFLFACKHIRNFLQLPLHQRVCQFPYEGCVVRKDLLPMTVRKHCYRPDGSAPAWWQPCYDLSTEFHLFAHDYHQRLKYNALQAEEWDQKNNRWIIKPAQGTRGKGHQVIFSQDEKALHKAACFAPMVSMNKLPVPLSIESKRDYDEDTGDRIVQLLVEYPLLIEQRKFDIRCFVFVRSFEPFVAFVPDLHYARLANKPYSLDKLDDYQITLTVSAYDDDEAIASAQERCFHIELASAVTRQYGEGVIDTNGMWQSTLTVLKELFGTAASREIGCWPHSSAYYSVDIIYDAAEMILQQRKTPDVPMTNFVPQPKVLEVNFMGDWHGVENAATDKQFFHEWIEDLMKVVVLTDEVTVDALTENPRLTRL